MRGRAWTPGIWLLMLVAACSSDGGCMPGEEVVESREGPVRLELVRIVEWSGGHWVGPVTNFWVRVHTDPPFEEYVGYCRQVDMTGDDAGKFVAFRCTEYGEQTWTVVRLLGGDRRILECDVPDADGQPDFAARGEILDGIERALRCPAFARGPTKQSLIALLETVEQVAGDEAVVAVVQLAVDPERGVPRLIYTWDDVVAAVPESVRPRVREVLCEQLKKQCP